MARNDKAVAFASDVNWEAEGDNLESGMKKMETRSLIFNDHHSRGTVCISYFM